MSEREAEELLLQLKENAELMVDLAYSSIIYDNEKIAREVYDLENLMDGLNDELQRLAIEDAKKGELGVNEGLAMIRLGICSEMISDAARELADVELRDVELHPIIKESISESDEVFTRVEVKEGSILANKNLGELELASKTGMWIIAIRSKNRWKYGVGKKATISVGDILFARGPKEGEKHLARLADGIEREI